MPLESPESAGIDLPRAARPRRSGRWLRGALAVVIAAGSTGCAELGLDPQVFGQALLGAGAGGNLDQGTVIAGLKEALRVGTQRSVTQTSRPGGFLNNPLVRIALPEQLQNAANALRAVGLGSAVDDLEVTMNRAAERAAGDATSLFVQAVTSLSIADARNILNGPSDAATQYFRGATESALRVRFEPVVQHAMREVGLVQAYDQLMGRVRALSLVDDPRVALNDYVVGETLDGLFTVLREEEQRIRSDPAARTTDLLRQVFGGAA